MVSDWHLNPEVCRFLHRGDSVPPNWEVTYFLRQEAQLELDQVLKRFLEGGTNDVDQNTGHRRSNSDVEVPREILFVNGRSWNILR